MKKNTTYTSPPF